jgi:3'-phosphoadenosine 5'-phosphosulfate sulfotransferase (PAPS reductase)/FAD synthetase
MITAQKQMRHVLGISGGKDSAALAIHMKQTRPELDIEYFFCDTEKELPEAYEFLSRLEGYLGKPIERLNARFGFDHWLKVYGGLLPSSQMRWCTRQLKIKPFEEWVGTDPVTSYVGIRFDEDRLGYKSTKSNITAVFPFKEAGIIYQDVHRILVESGVGVPKYYDWRSRSGCYFCFFQRKAEWIGLRDKHPELWEESKAYEKPGGENRPGYSWSQTEFLEALEDPTRAAEIIEQHEERIRKIKQSMPNQSLMQIFSEALDDEQDDLPCIECSI